VNLGLRVLGRRSDGYHLLESIFLPLDLADEVRVEVSRSGGAGVDFVLEGAPDTASRVPEDASNLAARAAEAFLRASGLRARIRVELRKCIPSAAGLGGGSSDAGSVLTALSELFPGALPSGELARLALRLGADVPFFLDPTPSLITGIGERVEPISGFPPLVLLLANPGVSLATAQVYEAWDRRSPALTPVEPGSTMRALSTLQGDSRPPLERLEAFLPRVLVNDLESAALRLCPQVGRLRERIQAAGALATGMSGSGATVFGVFPDEASAQSALEALGALGAPGAGSEQTGMWTRVAKSLGSEGARGAGAG
jgi:4-diphosphocytidyl-2-C-methyl-D-erythritol kinase